MLGFNEHNKRLEERRLEAQARRYDFPHPQGANRIIYPRGHGRLRRQPQGPAIPRTHPPREAVRHIGNGQLQVVPFQPDGLRINHYGPVPPVRVRQPRFPYFDPHFYPSRRGSRQSSEFDTDLSDCSSCEEYLNGTHLDSSDSDMESLAETLEDLSLRQRPSYERLRPMGFHGHNRHRFHSRRQPDHDRDERRHHNHHHQGHHHQHGHAPHRDSHRHPHDEFNGQPGNRVPGFYDRDIYRTGGWNPEDDNITQSDAHSDDDSAESW